MRKRPASGTAFNAAQPAGVVSRDRPLADAALHEHRSSDQASNDAVSK
jgi:hypothetical protein